jgi:AcrR family transcriptional regulator
MSVDDLPGGADVGAAIEADGPARAGRPRDESRDEVILEAALDLVGEVGYDRMSMDTLAARAKVSKATIYRRWPGKADLVAAALRQRMEPVTGYLVDTGSLRGDLLSVLDRACEHLSGVTGVLVCGLAQAAAADPELGATVARELIADKAHAAEVMLERARARGEVGPAANAALLHELVSAMTLQRRLTGGDLDRVYLVHIVDDVLLPVLAATAVPPAR